MAQGGYRVGVDVGGTFTDLICITPDGQVVLDKTPTTPADQSVGVLTGIGQLAAGLRDRHPRVLRHLEAFVHGTTTADNTMIEMSGAATGMLATEGHRDEIELRRDHKENIWDPAYPPPVPIARRRARIPIPERCDFEGNVVLALDEVAVRRGVQRLQKLGVESIAVCFLFSFVNPITNAGPRDHPGGVPRRPPHLAVPRGAAAGPRVRAHVDHTGQRLRGAEDLGLRRSPGRAAPLFRASRVR
jgi:N-methylhydantoinase A